MTHRSAASSRDVLETRTFRLPDWESWSERTAFLSYCYSYPHKTAYRGFSPSIPLQRLWEHERQSRLFLYAHLPFCEFRCGFCNLFTEANPADGRTAAYLRTLRTEAETVRDAIPDAVFQQAAIGGGTPTFLDCHELEELFAILGDVMGADLTRVPVSCEASPATIDATKLQLLKDAGVDRLSMGIQAFDSPALSGLGRPQNERDVRSSLDLLAAADFDILNLDLIYGADGQTVAGFLASLEAVLDYAPEEIYLYPLYVRSQTGLGKRKRSRVDAEWDGFRLRCYRDARDRLLAAGYEQTSLRMFRKASQPESELIGADYYCQTDGMVGLGCGARSYTERVHYSGEYAVAKSGVQAILNDYLSRSAADFEAAHHGYRLDSEERQRRHLILELMQTTGLDRPAYRERFGDDVLNVFPQLCDLLASGLATEEPQRLVLTLSGIERSDLIGPWLFSEQVRRLMEEAEIR